MKMFDLPPTLNQVCIESLGAMRVASYSVISKEPENEGRSYLNNWLDRQSISLPVRYFGFDIEVTQKQKDAGLRGYEVWTSVPEGVKPSDNVLIKEFSGGLYAAVSLANPFMDPFQEIPAAWKALHEWVISSDTYRGANHQWLEELLPYSTGSDMKLYYPINRQI
jgi:effector-binding domain-containing protein